MKAYLFAYAVLRKLKISQSKQAIKPQNHQFKFKLQVHARLITRFLQSSSTNFLISK
jgi:hypothetical protein